MLGGMLADTLLDFIQMFFTAGGMALIFFFVLSQVGGWDGMTSITSTLYNPKPFTLLPDMAGEAGYLGYFGAMRLDVLGRGLDGDWSRLGADPGPVPALDVGSQ
ncbi:MAG: hypothetical protein MZV70_21495 [Desulfobacterales bacterium]|nr:hypothetical protein [Desulfobacterales bacterium]